MSMSNITIYSTTIAKAIANDTNFNDILNAFAVNIIATTQANSRYRRNVTHELMTKLA